jgi:hypothetical protein
LLYNILYKQNVGNIKGLVKDKNKKQFIGTREYVDFDTGEVKGSEGIYKKKANQINFIMMFLDEVNVYSVLSGLGSSGKVLGFILKEYNDKDSMFYFSTSNKERMQEETKLSIGTVRAAVKDFSTSDILCHVRGAEYMLNPNLFFKGAMERRASAIEKYDEYKKLYELKKSGI